MRFHISLPLALILMLEPGAQACTTMMLTAKDGAVVSGRTMEFGFDMKSNVLVIPKGTEMQGTLPNNGQGIVYKTKYGIVGANALNYKIIMDGINDQGLFVSTLYFPGFAGYAEVTPENASHALAPHEYGAWLLGNFANLEDIRAHAADVVLAETPVPELEGPAPVHFIVRDSKGKSLVIEPVDGKLVVYDNPIGVLTNSPSFDWHMTNLRNYIGLKDKNQTPLKLNDGIILTQFGEGNGMFGLPGDTTPPARFVRAFAFSQSAIPADTAADEVKYMFHLMNQFDTPLGSVRDKHGNVVEVEYTVWTSVADLTNERWYFRTYNDQTIHMIDLHKAIAAANGKVQLIKMDSTQPGSRDISTDFMK